MQSQIVDTRKPSLGKKIGWGIMILLALLVFLLVSPYLTLNPDVYFAKQRAVFMAHTAMLLMHIVGAMLAIVIGPIQFLPGIRKGRRLKFHRWLGRIYLLGVLAGGVGGLYMAQLAYGGFIARFGFTVLATLWLYSGFRAYRHIRNKEIERHREWMTRNYALTFAGATLRLWLLIFSLAGIDFLPAYMTVAWLSWVPNLLVAEWIVRRTLPIGRRSTALDVQVEAIGEGKTA